MAPSCQAEETLSAHFDDLLSRQVQAEEDQTPIALQSSSSKSSMKAGKQSQADQALLATDAIVDHAAQVAAMMPGGLAVVGIYLYGPETIFGPATQQLQKVLDGLTPCPGMEADKLLFVSSTGRRFLCKHRPKGMASSATLPICTFNLAPVLASMSCMTCGCQVTISSPCTSHQQTLAEQIEAAASKECQRIQQGSGIIIGKVADANSTIADLPSDCSLEMELLCTPAACSTAEPERTVQEDVSGRLLMTGVMHATAMVNKKDTLATAVELIKADLINSLQVRLDILMAEAGDETASTEGDGSEVSALSLSPSQGLQAISRSLPQRVLCPTKEGLVLTEYVAPGELESDAAARAQSVLGSKLELDLKFEYPEGALSRTPAVEAHSWNPMDYYTQHASAKASWASTCSPVTAVSAVLAGVTAVLSMLYISR